MIIQCPACTTRYVVPDTAIGVDGRTVRCAKCRHSWFQEGPVLELRPSQDAEAETAPPAFPPAASQPPFSQPHVSQGAQEPEPPAAPEPAAQDSIATEPALPTDGDFPNEEPSPLSGPQRTSMQDEVRAARARFVEHDEDHLSQFEREPPFRPRRNPLKLWTWAAGIFALVAAGLIVAVSYWGLPDWVPVERPTFAAGNPDLRLDFPREQQERRTLPNGTEFFGARGTITNIGSQAHTIPPILIVLRDARDRKVYEWVVPPPQRTLAPGETVPVSEAVTDIPRSAYEVQFGWKPE